MENCDNVEQVTLRMTSKDERSVTFKRKQLEKELPHSFKEYKDDAALWQKELVDGVVKSNEKRQDVYKTFPMQK
ncbi:hypothetical protein OWO30_17855 [Bacillus safensis]|uniref:hypothetical protein n=1 Tax=Bacillus safensis TaxID=561879 RepID=UPI002271CB2A|nr:hypothetical protein [Bacillus safensis]MCY1120197.1 hypothetical protein [Bacillus safensis]